MTDAHLALKESLELSEHISTELSNLYFGERAPGASFPTPIISPITAEMHSNRLCLSLDKLEVRGPVIIYSVSSQAYSFYYYNSFHRNLIFVCVCFFYFINMRARGDGCHAKPVFENDLPV